MSNAYRHVELLTGDVRRRRWTTEQKLTIIEQSFEPGETVSSAARRHKARQNLALEDGATDIVTERGDVGVAKIRAMTKNIGADAVLECVGTNESMHQAINAARPGGSIGFVGVPHGVELKGEFLFFSQKNLLGGPAPVRRFLPHLIDLVLNRQINPGRVLDQVLPIADVAEGYRAMSLPADLGNKLRRGNGRRQFLTASDKPLSFERLQAQQRIELVSRRGFRPPVNVVGYHHAWLRAFGPDVSDNSQMVAVVKCARADRNATGP